MMRVMSWRRHQRAAWVHARSRAGLGSSLAGGLLCGACAVGAGVPPVSPLPGAAPATQLTAPAPMRVVSVSDEGDAAAEGSSMRRLLVVVDQNLDPLSVRPENFVVVTAAGARVVPVDARFVESSRFPTQRSLSLVGVFGEGLAQALLVVQPIHSVAGATLDRVSSPVEPGGSRPRALYWQRRGAGEAELCGAASSVVEVWWTRTVRRGESASPGDGEAARSISPPPSETVDEVALPFYARENHTMHCEAGTRGVGSLLLPAGVVEAVDGAVSPQTVLGPQHRVRGDETTHAAREES